MSTLLFLTGTTINENENYIRFVPSHTNHKLKSPSRGKKRKRQASNGSSAESSLSAISDMYSVYAPPSPTSSFSSFTSSSASSSPTTLLLSFNNDSSNKDHAQQLPCLQQKHQTTVADENKEELMTLQNEMDFTQDAWATLNVMFESVRLAYLNCAPKTPSHPTRLDAMEKELLSAYDDLELQVTHLDKHIQKLESSWYRYKTKNKSIDSFTPSSPSL